MNTPLLEFIDIEKSFFGVKVLKAVNFTVPDGAMLGMVGENGAGKSTLMNILGGNLAADSGWIRVAGVEMAHADPLEAERRGIAFIHQELNLFPNLTVAENLLLTRFPRTSGTPFIQRAKLNERSSALLHEVGLEVSPEWLVEALSPGERQLLEIAKALSFDARLIIFDEPTTSLSVREIDRLFALIAKLRSRGLAMIYISHTLRDVFRLCNHIVVLRDGEVVAQGKASNFNNERLVTLMVGRTLDQVFPVRGHPPSNKVLLDVQRISRTGVLHDISFRLHAGEVLGIAGLMGSGRSELARVIFGLDERSIGEVHLDGKTIPELSPRESIRRGMAFLTENRRSEGLCIDGSVADNLILAALPKYGRPPFGWLIRNALSAAVSRLRQTVRLDKKAPDSQPVRALSGGNQQKVVLGKWLLRDPRVLIMDEPTRGVDVGAKSEIYRLIFDLTEKGVGILVISSEMEELMGLCDRILVLKNGRWVDELDRGEFDCERILRAALGTSAFGEVIT